MTSELPAADRPDDLLAERVPPHMRLRYFIGRLFHLTCLASTWIGLVVLVVLLVGVTWKALAGNYEVLVEGQWRPQPGAQVTSAGTLEYDQEDETHVVVPPGEWRRRGYLTWQFLSSYDSNLPHEAGILAGLWGTLWLILFTALIAVPIGAGAAVYLEEYAQRSRLTNLIQLNLSNLAGVPSIVYGILGLTVFVRMFGIFSSRHVPGLLEKILATVVRHPLQAIGISVPFGSSVLSGALTLSLLVLPVIIITTQEALRAVPSSIRHASYALGATKWQTIQYQVLPAAVPGILTGVILALSRAVGETAPLVMLGIPIFIESTPGNIENMRQLFTNFQGWARIPNASFTALPMIVYNWVRHPSSDFQQVAAAGIVVLLTLLLCLNGAAIYIRQHFQKKIRW